MVGWYLTNPSDNRRVTSEFRFVFRREVVSRVCVWGVILTGVIA